MLFRKKEAKTNPLGKGLTEKTVQEQKAPATEFKISLKPQIFDLPTVKDKTKLNIRYPLIAPYAYAHIFWDVKRHELIYQIEEPVLNLDEQRVLGILEKGIEELINISFIAIKSSDVIIKYLEENAKVLLNEYRIKISKPTFLKLMYYIYRDFVGLNEIESLLKDYFIEDIECNGLNSSVYIVHRKYRNIRTNLIFSDMAKLTSFVEKLAQKCGKYISYANPLLDGALPDQSRVNATYTQDITSKGPSFTIRKFTVEPWSPVKLMQFRTVSPEVLAYLWLLIEYESNILVVGGTGSGKTSFLNSLAFFIPPQARVVSIEDSVTGDSKIIIKNGDEIRNVTIKDFVDNQIDAEVMTLDEKGRIIFVKPSDYIKHIVKKDIYEITTSTGRKIKVTKDHSLFSLNDSGLIEAKPIALIENKSFIAVPRRLPIEGREVKEINLIKHLGYFKEDFLVGEPIKKIFEKYHREKLKVTKGRYVWWKKNNLIKIEEFLKLDINFSYEELKELRIKSKNISSIPVLFIISKEFLGFCGLWLGDGSYDNYNRNSVIISNFDKECRNVIKEVSSYINSNFSVMNDKGCSLRIHSPVFYKFMKKVLKFDGYSNNKKIPEFIFNLSNKQIKEFIRGYFSADGCVKKSEVSCSSQSYELLEDLQSLFLRLSIITRVNDFDRKDRCINLSVSSFENLNKFKEIGFLQRRKNEKLSLMNKKAHHALSDVIPLSINKMKELNQISGTKLSWPYLQGMQNIGREYLQKIAPEGSEFNDISHTDILWDRVKKVNKLSSNEIEVFDLSIPKYEKFLCNNIFVHNTRELNLLHENWLPSVTREGVGVSGFEGAKQGEVTLFDLLKESFRQRPDYVIVGEIRGKEAYVLFQAMGSGHPSMSTMHAEDLGTMIRRLESPPISLSPALVNSLDIVCIMANVKQAGREMRKAKKIIEVVKISDKIGDEIVNEPFIWDPKTDKFYFKSHGKSYLRMDSKIFDKIITHYGLSREKLMDEFRKRTLLLMKMYRAGIVGFKEVHDIITAYYKTPELILKKFGIS